MDVYKKVLSIFVLKVTGFGGEVFLVFLLLTLLLPFLSLLVIPPKATLLWEDLLVT